MALNPLDVALDSGYLAPAIHSRPSVVIHSVWNLSGYLRE